MRGAWLGLTVVLGLVAVGAGAALASVLATRLYDGLALDVSRLLSGAPLTLETTLLVAVAAVETLVSSALTPSAANWLGRQPALGLLGPTSIGTPPSRSDSRLWEERTVSGLPWLQPSF